MNQAQKVIELIRNCLLAPESYSDSDGAELAREYSDLCSEANKRLQQCSNYIGSGRQSEAIHAAESKPVLLDLCVLLEFDGVGRWQKVCIDKNWAVAPEINGQLLEQINECYSSALALEPIIKEYRRAARSKNLNQAITLLRRLKQVDQANANWREDLVAFERRRLVEIENEANRAYEREDVAVLGDLAREIKSDSWAVDVADSLIKGIDESHDKLQAKNALEAGRRIVDRISSAYSALDYTSAVSAFDDYDALLSSGYFHPDDQMSLQYEEAMAWFSEEKSGRELDADFQAQLHRLTQLVDAGQPCEEVGYQLQVVSNFGMPLSQELIDRARQLVTTWHLLEQRKRRMKTALIVMGAALGAAVVLFGVWFFQYKRLRQYWVAALHQRHENVDYPAFTAALDELGSERRQLFGRFLEADPAIMAWDEKAGALKDSYDALRFEIATLQKQLMAYAKDEYNVGFETIKADLIKLEELGGDKKYIAEYRADWNEFENAKLEILTASIASMMPSLSDFNREPLVDIRRKCEDIDKLLNSGDLRKAGSPMYRKKLSSYREERDKLEGWLAKREAAYMDITNADSPSVYFQALDSYAKQFSSDFMIRNVREPRAISERWNRFNLAWLEVADQVDQVDKLVEEGHNAALNKINKALQNPNMAALSWFEYRNYRSSQAQDLCVIRGDVEEKRGSVGIVRSADTFMPASSIKPAQFINRNLPKGAEPKAMAHCVFMRDLSDQASKAPADTIDLVLAENILDILDRPTWKSDADEWDEGSFYNDSLKLLLVDYFVGLIDEMLKEQSGDWSLVKQQLEEIRAQSINVDWLLTTGKDIGNYNKVCRDALNVVIPVRDVARKYMLERHLNKTLVNQGWRWVARRSTLPEGRIEWRVKAEDRPSELWMVALADGSPGLTILLEELQGERHVYGELPFGGILLGPPQGFSSTEYVTSLLSGIDDTEAIEQLIPPMWPRVRQ